MTGDEVVPLYPHRPASPPRPGYLGLTWTARQDRHTGRWEIVGGPPENPGVELVILSPRVLPVEINRAEVAMVLALLLSDLDEDALSLMAADITRIYERNTDG